MSRSALPARSHPAAAGAGRHRPAQRAGRPVHVRRGRRGLLRHRFHRPDAALRGCALAPYPNLVSDDNQWSLCDAAPVVLPELGADLGQPAVELRGIEVRLGPSLTEIRGDAVTLSDSSSTVPTRTVVWAAGASDSQLIGAVAQRHHLPLNKGRLVVDEYLAVPGHPGVWVLGDAAAVLDLTHPGRITPPTAQHAQHQAKRAAGNVAASLQVGQARPYKHHNLGLVVDLAGRDAVAQAVGVPLTGLAAKASPAAITCSRCPQATVGSESPSTGSSTRSCPAPLSTQLLRNNSGGPAGGRAHRPLPSLQRHRRHEVQDPAACQHRRPVQQDRVETRCVRRRALRFPYMWVVMNGCCARRSSR